MVVFALSVALKSNVFIVLSNPWLVSSFVAEKRGSEDKKSSVKSSSREKQSEDTNPESKESDTKNEVNGTSEDIKSEGDTQSN